MPTPYDTLGIPPDAPQSEVRRAYQRRAAAAHPDRAGGDTEAMAEINAAYALIGTKADRAAYDRGERKQPPVEGQAVELLCGVLESVMGETPPGADLLAVIRRALDHQRSQVQSARKQAAKDASQVERRLKRLRFTGRATDDFLAHHLREHIHAARAAEAEADRALEVIKHAVLLLESYQYEADAPPKNAAAVRVFSTYINLKP